MRFARTLQLTIALLIVASIVGCSSTATAPEATPTPAATSTAAATVTPATFTDPFAYCAAVTTTDAPDARYIGPQTPDAIVNGLRTALNAPVDVPADVYVKGTFWRCMDGSVYACFVGANLPCYSKANTDKTPTQAEQDYCQQNPNSDFIPAVVTGHETIYDWQCQNGAAVAGRPVAPGEARGFMSNIWYKLTPP